MLKNYLTKVFSVLIPLFSFCSVALAQQEVQGLTARENVLQREYLRPSVSVVYLTDGSDLASKVIDRLLHITNDKYFANTLSQRKFVFNPTAYADDFKIHEELVKKFIDDNDFGRQIIRCWFPDFNSQTNSYDTSVIFERGKYAATEIDAMRNNVSYRKTLLNELGEKLIDRSYLIVVVVREGKKQNIIKIDPIVYKLDFGAETQTSFYEQGFNKANGIDKCNFPVVFVSHPKVNIIAKTLFSPSEIIRNDKAKNPEEEFNRIVEDANYFIEFMSASGADDLKVRSQILQTSPIRARIGTKEGLHLDRRYDAMELIQVGDKIEAKRRGSVRATPHIMDNKGNFASGLEVINDSTTSRFYQYAGGRITDGMTLVEHPELGIMFAVNAGNAGFGATVEYRFSDTVGKLSPKLGKMSGMSVYGRFELPTASFKPMTIANEASLFRFSVGLSKEFNFARFIFAQVSLGYGNFLIGRDKDGDEVELKTGLDSVDVGTRFGIYINPSMQGFAFVNYNIHMYGDGKKILEAFNENYSPLGLGLGFRMSF